MQGPGSQGSRLIEKRDCREIAGEKNPAHLLTENLNAAKREAFVEMCGQKYVQGKSDKSLELANY